MSKPKKEKWPQHKMGKWCGYQLHEDGSMQIASSHADKLVKALHQQQALDEFLASITRVSQRLGNEIAELKRNFWEGVKEDYGIDTKEKWVCDPETRMLKKQKSPDPTSEPR